MFEHKSDHYRLYHVYAEKKKDDYKDYISHQVIASPFKPIDYMLT